MSISIVQKTHGNAITGVTLTGVGAGNTLIALMTVYDPGTVCHVTGVTGDGSLVHATNSESSDGSNWNTDVWYKLSATGGSTTLTGAYDTTPAGATMHLYEISCTAGSMTFDVAGHDAGTNNATTIAVTVAASNELLISVIHSSNGMASGPSGWTDWITANPDWRADSAAKTASASGSNGAAWPFNANEGFAVSLAAFAEGSPSVPTLATVSPNTGNHGTTVSSTLTGTGFIGSQTVNVSGSGVTATNVVLVTATSITCDFVIAAGAAAGSRNISVTNANGTTGNQTFTVNTPPTITSISPNNADPNTTNTAVTITGTGIAAGGLAVTITSATDVTIHDVAFSSSVSASFQVNLGAPAVPGFRTCKLSQTVGGDSNSVSFQVNGTPTGTVGGGLSFGGGGSFSFT